MTDPRIEAAVAAMDGYYEDREWQAPGLAVIEAVMREAFAAADLVDPRVAQLAAVRKEIDWQRKKAALAQQNAAFNGESPVDRAYANGMIGVLNALAALVGSEQQ